MTLQLNPRWSSTSYPIETKTFAEAWMAATLWECRWCMMFDHPLFPNQRFEFHRPEGV